MILSRTHHYVFVEVPNTGSTAIAAELALHYDGERILHKHATFGEFLKTSEGRSRDYFAFASVRHPLDTALTGYFKMRSNHRGRFTSARSRRTPSVTPRHLQHFQFVQSGADFPTFFKRFHVNVYNNSYLLLHERLDYVVRFERLQEDFAAVLRRIGIVQVRPIPYVNRTNGKSADFWEAYPDDIRAQAMRLYWPYMRRWGYEFPPEWGTPTIDAIAELKFVSLWLVGSVVNWTMGLGPNSRTAWSVGVRDALRRVWS